MPERLTPDPRNLEPLIGISLVGFEKAGLFFDTRTGLFSWRDKTGASVIASQAQSDARYQRTPSGVYGADGDYGAGPQYAGFTGGFRAVGGGQGDQLRLYVLTEANYLANQAALPAYLATLTPDLALTLGSGGAAATGSLTVPDGYWVAARRVGAAVDAPIYLDRIS